MKIKSVHYNIELNYKNLPLSLMVTLQEDFRKRLFCHIKPKFKNQEELAKCLNCSASSLRYYQRDRHFIPVKIFQKMIDLCNSKDHEVNSSILQIKKRLCGKAINIRLPVYISSDLAALVSHALGDGHISLAGRFVYVNKEKILISKVKKLVNKVFGCNVFCDERVRKDGSVALYYYTAIGEILEIFGAIKGNKTYQDFDIPEWIKNGSDEAKRYFLKALFDDEGCVSKTRLALNMSKLETKKGSLIKLLDSFKTILLDLGVTSSRIGIGHQRVSKKGIRTINLVFVISGYDNIKRFYESIGFDHRKKQKKLKTLLRSYIRPPGKTRNNILCLLEEKPLFTHDLMILLNKTKKGIKYNLEILEKEGLIKREVLNPRKHLWLKNEKDNKNQMVFI